MTGRNTDLAIQGDGFFILDTGGERAYTRSGSFVFDAAGSLTGTGGALVQGWVADQSGAIDANRPVGSITIPLGQVVDPVGTTQVELGGSLSADTVVGGTAVSSISVFDSLGNEHEVQFTFTKVGANDWTLAVDLVVEAIGNKAFDDSDTVYPGVDTDAKKLIRASLMDCKTSKQGIFAGGDIVRGPALVVNAVQDGKTAANTIDSYLQQRRGSDE